MTQQASHTSQDSPTTRSRAELAERDCRHTHKHNTNAANTVTYGTASLKAQGPDAPARWLTSQIENGKCPTIETTAHTKASPAHNQFTRAKGFDHSTV
jgi:hypothetical protein